MPMHRRGFLQLLGAAAAAPFVVNAERADARQVGTVRMYVPSKRAADKEFVYIRAHKDLKEGEVICFKEGKPAGVAAGNIGKGNYGFMQIRGVAEVTARA